MAISHRDDDITRRELERRSNRLARVMVERGVGFDDYVVITPPNGIDFFVALFAALKVGGVPLPLSLASPSWSARASSTSRSRASSSA